jgi:polysaccharide export outer membrane protein
LLLATQFPLQPQDVVFVSSTNLVRWNRVMSQILPTIQGLWQTDVLINR